jgi:hypothetical protein
VASIRAAFKHLRGEEMNETMGPLIIERVWNAVDGRHEYRIAWTTEQLRRIGQAAQEGDQAFLDRLERAVRRALAVALTPRRG